jgi:hypothetical protein
MTKVAHVTQFRYGSEAVHADMTSFGLASSLLLGTTRKFLVRAPR